MSTLLYNPYLVKVATNGGGGQNFQKNGYIVCVRPLAAATYTPNALPAYLVNSKKVGGRPPPC